MQIDAFLQSIKPELSLYAVLLTFGIAAFLAARFFWNFEKQLSEENVAKVKDLIDNFQDQYITPILKQQITNAIDYGFENAISALKSALFKKETVSGRVERLLVADQELHEIINYNALTQRVQIFKDNKEKDLMVETHLFTGTGEQLIERLDARYNQKIQYSKYYDISCAACIRTAYAFFALSALLFIGLIRIIGNQPELIWEFWFFLTAQTAILCVYWFCRMEFSRRKIKALWKELRLHGTIENSTT